MSMADSSDKTEECPVQFLEALNGHGFLKCFQM